MEEELEDQEEVRYGKAIDSLPATSLKMKELWKQEWLDAAKRYNRKKEEEPEDDKKYLRMYLEPILYPELEKGMTKEQWRAAYWKLRRKYRKECLGLDQFKLEQDSISHW
uniref:Uncharacterized protein n=1 Tax=viral metagenome TaxID=1070528 RepID=A0A6H1ZHL0_9ZZZZ